ncbi:oxygen-independent coproporphyrinogen III oxidase [Rickettsiales bacterium]|nr:oxygen-independent coproporphyrinogen III oxidase [Rickettsiales bacterium]
MTADLNKTILKYDQQVPRYTSYPTAPHFSADMDGNKYAKWLSNLADDQGISLYFHIPFCVKMCSYCGCHTTITNRYDPIEEYVRILLDEIRLVAKNIGKKKIVSDIHFGGGSPSFLRNEDFLQIMQVTRQLFDIAENAEIAVEIDPRNITEDKVAAYAQAGVNRISMGVQDLNEDVQIAINRVQPFEMVKQTVDYLRQYGINAINMDLIYGLPLQSLEYIKKSVELVASLNPNRIALFGYAHVPWMKSHMRLIKDEDLPNACSRLDLYNLAVEEICKRGYTQVGIDHFVKDDDNMAIALKNKKLHRNFQGYTTHKTSVLIGMGASSIGAFPEGYVQNNTNIKLYKEAIAEGKLPIIKGIEINDDDRLRRDIINSIMCDMEVDIEKICARHGVSSDIFISNIAEIQTLAKDGLVFIDGMKIKMNLKARSLARIVCAAFDKYLKKEEKKHSMAV